jgi:hypothetical protein
MEGSLYIDRSTHQSAVEIPRIAVRADGSIMWWHLSWLLQATGRSWRRIASHLLQPDGTNTGTGPYVRPRVPSSWIHSEASPLPDFRCRSVMISSSRSVAWTRADRTAVTERTRVNVRGTSTARFGCCCTGKSSITESVAAVPVLRDSMLRVYCYRLHTSLPRYSSQIITVYCSTTYIQKGTHEIEQR